MLMFGCSSARMVLDGSEPFGCGFDFLMRGCPGYLGCLWNVTDIDLDRVTGEMVEGGEGDLAGVLRRVRGNCAYPNLNGASMVVYGLPSTLIS